MFDFADERHNAFTRHPTVSNLLNAAHKAWVQVAIHAQQAGFKLDTEKLIESPIFQSSYRQAVNAAGARALDNLLATKKSLCDLSPQETYAAVAEAKENVSKLLNQARHTSQQLAADLADNRQALEEFNMQYQTCLALGQLEEVAQLQAQIEALETQNRAIERQLPAQPAIEQAFSGLLALLRYVEDVLMRRYAATRFAALLPEYEQAKAAFVAVVCKLRTYELERVDKFFNPYETGTSSRLLTNAKTGLLDDGHIHKGDLWKAVEQEILASHPDKAAIKAELLQV